MGESNQETVEVEDLLNEALGKDPDIDLADWIASLEPYEQSALAEHLAKMMATFRDLLVPLFLGLVDSYLDALNGVASALGDVSGLTIELSDLFSSGEVGESIDDAEPD